MVPSPRALLGVAPALFVVAGSFALARHHGPDGSPDGTLSSDSVAETVSFLSPQDEERLHRVALKQETAEDLLEGRLTLAEAVDRFYTYSSAPESLANLRASLGGRSDRERVMNQVLSFVRTRVSQEPDRYALARTRLEAEATAYLADSTDSH